METSRAESASGWTPQQRVLAGIAAILAVELFDSAMRLRYRAGRALAARLYELDTSTSRGLHRSEIGMFIAGLSGVRRHDR